MVKTDDRYSPISIIPKKWVCYVVFLLCLAPIPAFSLEFELTEFFALEMTFPGKGRDDFLTVATVNFDGILGLRPNIIFSDHVSVQPSFGMRFPSIFNAFTSENVIDIPFLLFLDLIYHFHFPGLYPYLSLGMGYWGHFINAPSETSSNGVLVPGEQVLFRAAINIGMGISFLAGIKAGMIFSTEGLFGPNQVVHLLFDIDFALF